MKSIIAMGILSAFLALFGCGDKTSQTRNSLRAKQIRINELGEELKLLQQHKTEFDVIGITSNGVDCIYFLTKDNNFRIEFEAMVKD